MKIVTARLTALSLIFSILLANPVFAYKEPSKILFWETFNQYATNEIPAAYNLPQNGYARVYENESKTDKSLMVKSESDDFSLSLDYWSGISKEERARTTSVFAQLDVRAEGVAPDINIGLRDAATASDVYLISIDGERNIYQTANSKRLGAVGSTDVNIALGYDLALGVYSVYINGKAVVSNWKFPSKVSDPERLLIKLENPGEEGSAVYFDNLFIYSGDSLRRDIPKGAYNADEVAAFEIKDEAGSQHFIDNDFEDALNPTDGLSNVQDKGNTLEVVYDEAAQNHYLYFDKILPVDPFIDVKIDAGSKFVIGQMDVMVTKPGAKNCLFMVRDNTTVSGTQMDEYPVLINANMQLTCGGKTAAQLKTNTWYKVAAIFNVKKKSVDLYLNGELVLENTTYTTQPVKVINLVRVTQPADGGMGDLCIDNFKVYEGKVITDSEEYVSIFSDGSNEKNLLAGSIAVHGYSGTGYQNGEKFNLETQPLVDDKDNDRVYVAVNDVNKLFDKELTAKEDGVYEGGAKLFINTRQKDDVTLIDFKAYAESQGKSVLDDGNGMQVAGDKKVNYPEETVRELNNFLFFRRVEAPELQELFNKKTDNGQMHPRIIATAEDFERIKGYIGKDEVMTYWHNSFLKSADNLVANVKPVVYHLPDGIRLLDTSRMVLERMEHLGYSYQMTKDKKYADRAWQEMEAVFAFQDWNPGHMLDPAEMMAAVAIGYDWMYEAFTEEQRATAAEKIKDMGLTHVRDGYYGRLTIVGGTGRADAFVKWNSNFNTVINGGAFVAALAIADRYPEFCFDVLEKGQRSLEYVMYMIAPDGGWQESVNYWGYNFNYFMRMIGSLDTALGDDLGLTKYKGLTKTTMFAISQESPIAMNPFHDAVSWPIDATPLSWFAKKYNNANDMRFRKYTAENMGRSGKVYDAIYYDPEMAEGEIDMPLDWYVRGIEAVSSKYSVTDRDGLFFASHAGPTVCYHSHPDTGAFVLDLMGERWSEDLGMDTYTPTAPGEYYYRKRTEGHSTIVINPDRTAGQLEGTNTPVIRFESKPKGSISVMDMTGPYSPHATKTLRGFKVDDDRRSLTVRDEIDLIKENSTVYWFMQTKATEAEETADGLILKKNGKTLRLQFQTNAAESSIEFDKALALSTSPQMEEDVAKNAEYNRVAIKLIGSGHVNLTVKLSAFDDYNTEMDLRPIGEWTIPNGELKIREPIQLDGIQLDGVDLYSFDKNKSSFSVFRNEGEPFPAVTATAGAKPIEVEQATEEKPMAVITAYNNESKEYRNRYAVNFITVKSLEALKDYRRVIVENLTVGSEPEAVNAGPNMLDGDLDTRWTTFTMEDEAVFDLRTVTQIDAFATAFWKGNERVYEFEVLASEDGVHYQSVFKGASGGTTAGMEVFDKTPFQARYVKLVAKGNTVNQNTNVVEFALLQKK